MPRPSHSSRFYHPHNIGWGVQSIKLLFDVLLLNWYCRHSAGRCHTGHYTPATPRVSVDKPDIAGVAILFRCQNLYWRMERSAMKYSPYSETSSSSTSQRLFYITQDPEVHNRVHKSPLWPTVPSNVPISRAWALPKKPPTSRALCNLS
jgi:hypothetical protein